ncbi:MAG TPA: hypothetical protein VKT71_06020 [Candidatus Acidoferrales bacterium]|nr:hypothetical protein [Candidatus Acidoferrales bacterium]
MPEQYQFDLKKIVRWFVREEVKTPLAFFFKVIPYMTAVWIAILYSPVPSELKLTLVKFSAWVFIGLCGLVALFAFLRPKYLVYGETGHRAEKKIEFGTEKKTFSSEELATLKQIQNPQQLPSRLDEEPR